MYKVRSGIYKIRNILDEKVYVGSSVNFIHRWKEHKSQLKRNKHHSEHLQKAWNKYGEKSFEFEVLEIVKNPTKQKLEAREQYWIDLYVAVNSDNGYNICPKAGSVLGKDKERVDKNKELILKFCAKKGYRPSRRSKDKKEQRLGKVLRIYIGEWSCSYDRKFVEFIKKYPNRAARKIETTKNEILAFCRIKGYRPIKGSANKNEDRLASNLWNYLNFKSCVYAPDFSKKLKLFPIVEVFRIMSIKKEILQFIKEKGYIPSCCSLNTYEKKLGKICSMYASECHRYYDANFANEIKKYPTWQQFKKGR